MGIFSGTEGQRNGVFIMARHYRPIGVFSMAALLHHEALIRLIPFIDSFYHLRAVRIKSKLVREAILFGVKDWIISSTSLRDSSKVFKFNQLI